MTDRNIAALSKRERIMGFIYFPIHTVLISLLINFIAQINPGITEYKELVNFGMYALGIVYCLVFFFSFLKKSFLDAFDVGTRFFKTAFFAIMTDYALNIAVAVLLAIITGGITQLSNPNNQAVQSMAASGAIKVTTVLLAPIVEEILFRALIFGTLKKYNKFGAYVITIAIFAFYHLWQSFVFDYNWLLWFYLLQYVPAGLILCRAYDKTDNIWCPILTHALLNFVSISLLGLM